MGQPLAEMRDRFTRVLRGHIAIARALFPDGTTGAQLDTLARQFLWQAGIDFDHGTGHGVGSYLCDEGPARISKLGTTALRRGMILSNEPGYYKTDAYGIRIETLELVVAAEIAGAEKPVNAFETLTLAPIDRRYRRRDAARSGTRRSTTITPASVARCARMSTRPPKCGSTPPPRRSHLRVRRLSCPGLSLRDLHIFSESPAAGSRGVGKGALAPCPPSDNWWARFALPTLRDFSVMAGT